MFLPVFLIACGNKQADPEVPVEEPADTPAEEAPVDGAPAEGAPAEGAPAEGAAADCAEGAVIYQHSSAPLQGPRDARVWALAVHDTGYWLNTTPEGEKTGCLAADELAGFQTALTEADIAAPPLEPGMARCMAMPHMEQTVTVGEASATWQSPCGMSNPTESLSALISSIDAMSHGRQ